MFCGGATMIGDQISIACDEKYSIMQGQVRQFLLRGLGDTLGAETIPVASRINVGYDLAATSCLD